VDGALCERPESVHHKTTKSRKAGVTAGETVLIFIIIVMEGHMKKGQLHELLAVEGELRATKGMTKTEVSNAFIGKLGTFQGCFKQLKMFDENRKAEEGENTQNVADTVTEKLNTVKDAYQRYWDLRLQKESANQAAKADVVIDGKVYFKDVPVTFLLNMETELQELRGVYNSAPTLAPGTSWILDEQKGRGIYKSQHQEEKQKTEKTVQFKVLVQATKEFPAQVKEWAEDRPIGKFLTETWSGMISQADKALMIGRLDKLIRAFKKARQRANGQETESMEIGQQIFDYINAK
jgi:hypothetical protein